ncbi:hypothetical protein GOZ83_12990 [Agrobacterium vitis]|nr:hypothetical protein [Allorhizobium ampelinum]MVA45980.1 hypothetical protein [Agrobacterium vitis]
MQEIVRQGGNTAFPVVVEKRITAGIPLLEGAPGTVARVWEIPVPAEKGPCIPDVVIAPVVGYDHRGFRLGYGGGCLRQDLLRHKPGLKWSASAVTQAGFRRSTRKGLTVPWTWSRRSLE